MLGQPSNAITDRLRSVRVFTDLYQLIYLLQHVFRQSYLYCFHIQSPYITNQLHIKQLHLIKLTILKTNNKRQIKYSFFMLTFYKPLQILPRNLQFRNPPMLINQSTTCKHKSSCHNIFYESLLTLRYFCNSK